MCRCLDEEEAVAEVEAGARWRPGCGGWGGGGQGATAGAEAGGRRVGRGWGGGGQGATAGAEAGGRRVGRGWGTTGRWRCVRAEVGASDSQCGGRVASVRWWGHGLGAAAAGAQVVAARI
jgi:hypothetical protein